MSERTGRSESLVHEPVQRSYGFSAQERPAVSTASEGEEVSKEVWSPAREAAASDCTIMCCANDFVCRICLRKCPQRRLQHEINVDHANGKSSCRDADTQLLKKPAKKKRKRIQIIDRLVQFEPFFKTMYSFGDQ